VLIQLTELLNLAAEFARQPFFVVLVTDQLTKDLSDLSLFVGCFGL